MSGKKIALIGAGGSARKFLVNSNYMAFDLFTSEAGQELFGKYSLTLSEFCPSSYDLTIILVFDYKELAVTHELLNQRTQLYWFNAVDNLLIDLSNSEVGHAIYIEDDVNGLEKLESESENKGGLTVVYDLLVEPMTFDFLTFLVQVEMERKKQNLDYLEIIIPPGPYDGFNNNDLSMQKIVKENRFHNILLGLVRLLECPVYVSRTATRGLAKTIWDSAPNKYPSSVDFSSPKQNHSIRFVTQRVLNGESMFVFQKQDTFAHDTVSRWLLEQGLEPQKCVTLTLRESPFNSSKNSNINEWLKFADYLTHKGYAPVFIRDTDKALLALPEWPNKYPVFSIASFDFVMRMSLNQLAYANFGVNNGCNIHWYFCEFVRYVMVKIVDSNHLPSTPQHLEHLGIDPSNGISGAKPWQKVSNVGDDFPNLVSCFEKLEFTCRNFPNSN